MTAADAVIVSLYCIRSILTDYSQTPCLANRCYTFKRSDSLCCLALESNVEVMNACCVFKSRLTVWTNFVRLKEVCCSSWCCSCHKINHAC